MRVNKVVATIPSPPTANSIILANKGESPPVASQPVVASMASSSGSTMDCEYSEDTAAFLGKQSIDRGDQVSQPVLVKLEDLSPYFHLKLACAAEEWGIPKSHFKKLCKNLGLVRWPGCKVRRLRKAIDRLELKVAGGSHTLQVEEISANRLHFLKECYDKLLHGTLAQMEAIVDSRAMVEKEYRRFYSEVVRSGDECQRCHGLINIQCNAMTMLERDRLDDSSATEHSKVAGDTVSGNSNGEGSLGICRGREVGFDDVLVVGLQNAEENAIVTEEGIKGCSCYIVSFGRKWYPRFEKEGPWLEHIGKTALNL